MKNEIHTVIWDMGGVLLRTEDHSPRIQLATRLGIQPDELYEIVFNGESAFRATLGEIRAEQHWEIIRQKFDFAEGAMDQFSADFWGGDMLDTDLIDYIQSLRPHYITALLSNAWSDARKEMTHRYSLLDAFDYAVFSAEVGVAKPDPGIYLYLLDQLSLKANQAVFIDDVLENVDSARQLGMHGVHFRERDQALDELTALNITAGTA